MPSKPKRTPAAISRDWHPRTGGGGGKMNIRRLSVMVIAAAVLVQAGSAATASVSAKPVKACELATAEEIAEILGVQVSEPIVDDRTRCEYSDDGVVVTILSTKYNKFAGFNPKQADAKKIPGLKKAYTVFGEQSRLVTAQAVKGKKFLTVIISSATGAEIGVTLDQLTELTKTAFKRL